MPPLRGWFSLQLIDGLRLFGKLRASCGLHSSAASRLGVGIVASSYRSAGRAAPPKICADSRTEVVAFAVVALAEQQVSPLAVADAPDFGRNDNGWRAGRGVLIFESAAGRKARSKSPL
ncbi:MAG TPA: hypothetical protein VN911_06650 [Candidatus Acidoferrum sp.]|nr:hypothetical protein [Candidatus Acidoferrum sp.]